MVTELHRAGQQAQKEADQIPLSTFHKRFLSDFYASFYVGQNDYILHFLTLTAFARSYNPHDLVSVEDLQESLTLHIEKMRMPPAHSKFRENKFDPDTIPYIDEGAEHREFSRDWGVYLKIIGATHFGLPFDNLPTEYFKDELEEMLILSEEDLYLKTATRLVDRDTVYQTRIRDIPKDPHASRVKTHVIDGVTTNSATIDNFYGRIRQVIYVAVSDQRGNPRFSSLQMALGTLRINWLANHLGQNFGIL